FLWSKADPALEQEPFREGFQLPLPGYWCRKKLKKAGARTSLLFAVVSFGKPPEAFEKERQDA
ncbi:hypothetical protein NW820_10895, partial [Synechococcus sp. R55.7]|uniref:hypothetical protein n=1 Tax=Synechococcus sp. R55.7 TaxID=2964500 RepID=UPI0039C3658B